MTILKFLPPTNSTNYEKIHTLFEYYFEVNSNLGCLLKGDLQIQNEKFDQFYRKYLLEQDMLHFQHLKDFF